MTTARVTPGPRPDDEGRDDDHRENDLGPEDVDPSGTPREGDARRLAQMELERATDEGMRPPAPAEREGV